MKLYWGVCIVWTYLMTQVIGLQNDLGVPYYHELSKQRFKPPNVRNNDSYFGFGLTYDNYCKSLVISSPRYDNIGKLYDCNIINETCEELQAETTRYLEDYTHDYWLGATVKAGPEFIVTCSPRYTEKYTLRRGNDTRSKVGTFAQCYKRSKNSRKLEATLSISQIARNEDYNIGDVDENMKIERFMDSFGWSVDVSSTTKSNWAVLIGGPAMYTGRVMVYDKFTSSPKLLARSEVGLPKHNFGYSVASGYFFNKNDLIYAVGSTYGRNGSGSVHFFNNKRKKLGELSKSVDYDLVGSMFGAVLCSAKFHENGLTNLMVGAPTFAKHKRHLNRGAVYVYLADTNLKKNNMKFHRIISNDNDGSYFGSAIVNLGDLNRDNSDDIAIAAPYENDGEGAVYLYSGAKIISMADTVSYMQKIKPKGYKSFGMSLTALQDYDENGCNELAVGAPYDDEVLLYKCMASVNVSLDTEFPTDQVQNRTRENRTDFNYRVCLIVDYPVKPKEIEAVISTRVEFTHPSAKLMNPNDNGAYTFNTSLAGRPSRPCELVGFRLPADGNYELEINILVTLKLWNDPYRATKFDPKRVILSDLSILKKHESVWVAECSGDKECRPDLTLSFLDNTKVPYIIGSSEEEEFSISVSNTGDIAYDSFVLVLVFGTTVHLSSQQCVPPKTTDKLPPIAAGANDIKICTPRNPIKTNDIWISDPIVLDMKKLTNQDLRINIQALLFNHRKDINISNRTYEHTIDMKSDPNYIRIKGISNIGEAHNMTRTDIKDGKVMEHKYTIKNNGTAKWVDVKCDIILENNPAIMVLNMEMRDKYRSYECIKTSETMENMKTCMIPSIGQDSINLVILIRVQSENTDVISGKGLTVKSTIHLHLDDTIKSKSVSTLIQLDDAMVPWWVILIAVLIGLFILVIIGFTLYKCGFLSRKKKKDLEALQKSVKRQTMRMSGMPPSSDDQTRILEQVADEIEGTQVIENKAFCDKSEDTSKTETEDTDAPKTKQ